MQPKTASPRRHGVLYWWQLSKSGGQGKVFIPATREMFFICRRFIISGEPIVGSAVTFTPGPIPEGKRYPQATQAVIDNTQPISLSDILSGCRPKEVRP